MDVRLFRIAPLALAILVGSVLDRTTGQPLPGVAIVAGNVHATSHADGSFRLTNLKPGALTLSLTSDDVPPQTVTVTVGNSTTRHDVRVCSTTLDYNCGPPQ
jgi:hypothetical protein